MGARESRAQNPEDAEEQAGPPDYYELLEVDENATQDEIRVRITVVSCVICYRPLIMVGQKSFRKLALIHHPDKNQDDVEGATKRFAAIQQAYEVRINDYLVFISFTI